MSNIARFTPRPDPRDPAHYEADVCSACGIDTSQHWDPHTLVWLGCYGAITQTASRVVAKDPAREANAREHATLHAAQHLAALLYGEEEEPSALTLQPRELACVRRMVAAILTVHQLGLRHGMPPVQGCWRKALDEAKEYRP